MPTVNYSKYLSKSNLASGKDVTTFEKYKTGEIDIHQCFDEWWMNNKPKLNKREFKQFLAGMGYVFTGKKEDDDDLEEDE